MDDDLLACEEGVGISQYRQLVKAKIKAIFEMIENHERENNYRELPAIYVCK